MSEWVAMYENAPGGMLLAMARMEAGQCPACGTPTEIIDGWARCPHTYALKVPYRGGVEFQLRRVEGDPKVIYRKIKGRDMTNEKGTE